MPDKPYYLAYEARYKKVFAAGGDCWGHSTDDETLATTLEKWVSDNQLKGINIIEFACGEGASGVLLSGYPFPKPNAEKLSADGFRRQILRSVRPLKTTTNHGRLYTSEDEYE
jgi:hypothetical protein